MTSDKPDIVARARAMLSDVTPGGWAVTSGIDYDEGEYHRIGAISATAPYDQPAWLLCPEPDAAFIAAAPQLVRELCDAVDEQQKQADAWRLKYQNRREECDFLRAEVERLRAEIAGREANAVYTPPVQATTEIHGIITSTHIRPALPGIEQDEPEGGTVDFYELGFAASEAGKSRTLFAAWSDYETNHTFGPDEDMYSARSRFREGWDDEQSS